MVGMAAPKGRMQRPPREQSDALVALYARVEPATRDTFEQIASRLGVSRAAALDLVVRGMPLGPDGLPVWLDGPDQLPLDQAS